MTNVYKIWKTPEGGYACDPDLPDDICRDMSPTPLEYFDLSIWKGRYEVMYNEYRDLKLQYDILKEKIKQQTRE